MVDFFRGPTDIGRICHRRLPPPTLIAVSSLFFNFLGVMGYYYTNLRHVLDKCVWVFIDQCSLSSPSFSVVSYEDGGGVDLFRRRFSPHMKWGRDFVGGPLPGFSQRIKVKLVSVELASSVKRREAPYVRSYVGLAAPPQPFWPPPLFERPGLDAIPLTLALFDLGGQSSTFRRVSSSAWPTLSGGYVGQIESRGLEIIVERM